MSLYEGSSVQRATGGGGPGGEGEGGGAGGDGLLGTQKSQPSQKAIQVVHAPRGRQSGHQ